MPIDVIRQCPEARLGMSPCPSSPPSLTLRVLQGAHSPEFRPLPALLRLGDGSSEPKKPQDVPR
eukprot:9481590-Pyramimonas_sp.AAC.1